MPDKEGSDDEKKSTKSVVNKKQKQFLNQEELDLTKIAEAFGGYLIEIEIKRDKSGTITDVETTAAEKELAKRAQEKQRKIFQRAKADRLNKLKKDQNAEMPPRRQVATDSDSYGRYEPAFPVQTEVDDGTTGTAPGQKSKPVKVTKVDPRTLKNNPRGDIIKPKPKSKVKVSQALKTAERPVIKGGPSVKRGDPVEKRTNPTERPEPIKKKPVPEIGGYKFNTFSPKEMKKRKTFKQAFGRPTGADPKTGKPTYRVSPVGPAGQKRKRTRGGFKALPRSKNLPDYDTVKTAVDMGLNPDEIDKNKFIDQKVRDNRMKRLKTPDPFKVDTSQASKEVAKQFGTKPVKGGLDFGEPTIPKKVKTQDPLTGRDFKRFRKQQQTAVRTKVRSDIEKNIGKVAKRNVSKAKIATPVVKTLGKETGEAAVKAAGKRALKKAGMKAVAKQIPGVGSLIAGGEAAFRAAKGDMTGAALSLGQAIPGVSIPLAGVDVAREVARARGGAKVGQKVATQVARSLPGSGKKVKTATKVVNPTVVGSAADTSKRFRDFLNKNKMMGVAGGAALGKGVEVASRNTFRGIKPKDVKGGRVGRRSAKQ